MNTKLIQGKLYKLKQNPKNMWVIVYKDYFTYVPLTETNQYSESELLNTLVKSYKSFVCMDTKHILNDLFYNGDSSYVYTLLLDTKKVNVKIRATDTSFFNDWELAD